MTIDTADAAVGERLRILGTGAHRRPGRGVGQPAAVVQFRGHLSDPHQLHVWPVNPTYEEVLGLRCYPTLADLPEPPDIVDVFRRTEEIPSVVEEAIDVGAKVVWFQLGLRHEGGSGPGVRVSPSSRTAASRSNTPGSPEASTSAVSTPA